MAKPLGTNIKIALISDTHAQKHLLKKYFTLINKHLDNSDIIVHLGDNIDSAKKYLKKYPRVILIKGNHDNPGIPQKHNLKYESLNMLFIHGNGNPITEKFNVVTNRLREMFGMEINLNSYYKRLYSKYASLYDIVFYGHTHIPKIATVNNTIFFCPGGLFPESRLSHHNPSFGTMYIKGRSVNLSVIEIIEESSETREIMHDQFTI